MLFISAGSRTAINTAITAITTSISMSENPRELRLDMSLSFRLCTFKL